MSSQKLITAALQGQTLYLKFSDPHSRNSFSLNAAEELRSAFEKFAGQYDTLIFSSEGRVFCSGGNLSDYAQMDEAQKGIEVNRKITAVLNGLERLPALTICLVNGDCFGGGVELISSFDRVLCSPHVLLGLWQRRIGLSFGWGGGRRLKNRIGLKTLRGLALEAGVIGANEAKQVGLIDGICRADQLLQEAEKLAANHRKLPQIPVARLKAWTAKSEQTIFEELWWNEDHRQVLQGRKKPGAKKS